MLQVAASDKTGHRNNVVYTRRLIEAEDYASPEADLFTTQIRPSDAIRIAVIRSQSETMLCACASLSPRAICVTSLHQNKTNGDNMRICRLYPVHAGGKHEFKWEWRSEHCDRRSRRKFDFFYDCMEDARSRGFRVILAQPTGESSPTHYSLAL